MPRAEIATTQAKHTLEQLHAELGGKILDNKAEADRLRAAMVNVEAVLKLLDPEHNLRAISVRRRTPNPWFKRGTVYRTALEVLRTAKAPLSVSEIAVKMLGAKRITDAPRSAVAKLDGAIRCSLENHPEAVTAVSHERPARWKISVSP
jgi:hypothetical protein